MNPEMFDHVQYDAAMALVEFMFSVETQQQIAIFGLEEFGQPLFSKCTLKQGRRFVACRKGQGSFFRI